MSILNMDTRDLNMEEWSGTLTPVKEEGSEIKSSTSKKLLNRLQTVYTYDSAVTETGQSSPINNLLISQSMARNWKLDLFPTNL